MIPRTFWTIGGRPVPLRDFSANSIANGGFDQMRGVLPDTEARRFPHIEQGAKVKGFTAKGRLFWEGEVSGPPAPERGIAVVGAQGAMIRAAKRKSRLLFQSRDVSLWIPHSGPPYNIILSGEDNWQYQQDPAALKFETPANTLIADGEDIGFVFAAPGTPGGLTKLVVDWKASSAVYGAIDCYLQNYPSGAVVAQSSTAPQAGSDVPNVTFSSFAAGAGNRERFDLRLSCDTVTQGQPNPLTWGRFWGLMFNIRVYGMTTADTYYASQAVSAIGAILGYDTSGVQQSGLNVLPFDWATGSHEEALSYVASLEDRYWRVVDDDLLEYEPWGTNEYRGYQSDGVIVDLVPMELYNAVTVYYRDIAGNELEVTKDTDDLGIVDPLATSGQRRVWEETLADPQPDSTLASSVASFLLVQKAKRQYAGGLGAVRLYDRFGREATHDVRGGDAVRIMDFEDAPVLRAAEATYGPNGVNVGIEEPAGAVGLIGRAGLERARMPVAPEHPVLEPEEAAAEAGMEPEPAADRGAWLREQHGGLSPFERQFEQPRYEHTHMHGPGRHHKRPHSAAHRHYHPV